MTSVIGDVWRAVTDVARYSWRTGRWWVPAAVVALAVGGILLVTVKAAVPVAVYTLF